jgi:hypothetical protein
MRHTFQHKENRIVSGPIVRSYGVPNWDEIFGGKKSTGKSAGKRKSTAEAGAKSGKKSPRKK